MRIFGFIFGVAAALIVYGMRSSDKGVDRSTDGSQFRVSDKRHAFEYELASETRLRGVLTMTGRQAGISQGGAVLTLHYLSHADRDKFMATHDGDECPASFFNRHAEQRILIPADDEVSRKLRKIDFDDYRIHKNWRDFELKGSCIKSASLVEVDGKAGTFPRNMFENCLTMVVKDIEIFET